MSTAPKSQGPTKIIVAVVVILAAVAWLTFTGVRDNKSYYVTISELNAWAARPTPATCA